MGTLTLSTMRSLLRSRYNEASTVRVTDTELNAILNDGYKDTAVKGLCYECKIPKTNIPSAVKMVPLRGSNVVRVMFVEYDKGVLGSTGLLCAAPQMTGYEPIKSDVPKSWFQWGEFLTIEPPPDVATYDLNIFAACYPAAEMGDSDTPSSLPAEFHECVYLFGEAFTALKLKRWSDFHLIYNKYIDTVQSKRMQFISKFPDSRDMNEIPDVVNG
jgi:hypothetical protein